MLSHRVVGWLFEVAGKEGFNADSIALVASRPRLMLSHLWAVKRDSTSVPTRFSALGALVNSMMAKPKPRVDDNDDESADDECMAVSGVYVVLFFIYFGGGLGDWRGAGVLDGGPRGLF